MSLIEGIMDNLERMQKNARKQGMKDVLEALEESTNTFLKCITEGNENLRPGLEMMLVVIDGLKKAHCGNDQEPLLRCDNLESYEGIKP